MTGKILHFDSEAMNRVEAHHSALKAWFRTSCDDLDTGEIERVTKIRSDLENLCKHYIRNTNGLSCTCELIIRYHSYILLKLKDVERFCTLIYITDHMGSSQHHRLKKWIWISKYIFQGIIEEFSRKPISKFQELRRLGSGLGFESGSGTRGRGRSPYTPGMRGRDRGRSRGRSSGLSLDSSVTDLFVIVLSNRGSTKFLPAYSRKDQTNGIIVIGYLEDQQHFVVYIESDNKSDPNWTFEFLSLFFILFLCFGKACGLARLSTVIRKNEGIKAQGGLNLKNINSRKVTQFLRETTKHAMNKKNKYT
ncbi:hypothetical protein M9H77_21425 [Catharanthus roseus]|uniref:Uncharacterized protein n=1 Tax=Catharanthus roseus TaxID=4058 RepID=A0ACC0AQ27_CATRO|nr:hypothetical protein M9H77_21425 [Catharanthus roseus]